MKAPDKIYVRPSAFTPPWPSAIDENDKYGGLEYIRKDALLEWLKQKIKDYWADDENTMGIYPYALKEVINKLNSL